MGLTIDLVNVGQGDAIVVATSSYSVLVDAGPKLAGQRLAEFIHEFHGSKLGALILTHVDDDHVGGAPDLLQNGVSIEKVFFNDPRAVMSITKSLTVEQRVPILNSVRSAVSVMDIVLGEGISIEPFWASEILELGDGFYLRCLSPTRALFARSVPRFTLRNRRQLLEESELTKNEEDRVRCCSAENESSMVFEVTRKMSVGEERVALLTSDCCVGVLAEVTGSGYRWTKIPHHGSWHNTTIDLVRRWRGSLQQWRAGLSVGENNYGHPEEVVVSWFSAEGAKILCTTCHGNVRWAFETDLGPGWQPLEGSCHCG